jgi:uridine kinase
LFCVVFFSVTSMTLQSLSSERETLSFLVCSQYEKLFSRRLKFIHSFHAAFYYEDFESHAISESTTAALSSALIAILATDVPIEFVSLPRAELFHHYADRPDKLALLKCWQTEAVSCIRCDGRLDLVFAPHSNDKQRLQLFELLPFQTGIVLRFPCLTSPSAIPPWNPPAILSRVIAAYRETKRALAVETVADLNRLIYDGKIAQTVAQVESLHERQLADLATAVAAGFPAKRVITICGASSSNKTTFAHRLAAALRAIGHDSVVIGMDDYFLDARDIPFEADGMQDWEAVTCLNFPVLGERLEALLAGKTIPRRRLNWITEIGEDHPTETMTLGPNAVLIIEGIHGLNPRVLEILGRERVTPIYLQSTCPINLDDTHRFPASDLRLLRRLIRDFLFRATPPLDTYLRWTSVRLGEMKNIFPFMENAQLFFNSASVHEVAVLAAMGLALSKEGTLAKAEGQELGVADAFRMQRLLNFFYPVSSELIPKNSFVREFIGGLELE